MMKRRAKMMKKGKRKKTVAMREGIEIEISNNLMEMNHPGSSSSFVGCPVCCEKFNTN